jgi:hypothetical protein
MSAPIPHPVPDGALSPSAGALPGATRDAQSITRDWQLLREPIAGVDVREVKNILKDNGCLTEVWRDVGASTFVLHRYSGADRAAGASRHGMSTPRHGPFFASHGHLKIVL